MTNVGKMLQMNITMLTYCLPILTLNGVRGEILHIFMLLTNENIIFMSKIIRQWLKNMPPFNPYCKALHVEQFLTKLPKVDIKCYKIFSNQTVTKHYQQMFKHFMYTVCNMMNV